MAKLRSGIFGPISGKIGGVVGAHWKDIAYIRARPQKTKKSSTPSLAQIASRQKFKFVQEVLVPFYPFITIGFRNMARKKTEINAAFSQNYANAVTGTYPDLAVDYAMLSLSKGTLPLLISAQAEFADPESMKVSWATDKLGAFDDQIMFVLYSPELKISDGFVGGILRRDMEFSFSFNPKLIGQQLEVYISVISLNGARVGDSQYLGRINPL